MGFRKCHACLCNHFVYFCHIDRVLAPSFLVAMPQSSYRCPDLRYYTVYLLHGATLAEAVSHAAPELGGEGERGSHVHRV